MNTRIAGFFLLIFLGMTAALAQKTTPETTITTPSDTTKRPDVKPEPESPEIELPDVLILGKDQYHRTGTSKKELTPESPELIRSDKTYEPISTWFSSESSKPHIKSDSLAERQFWARLRGGTRYTFVGDAGYWQKLSTGDALGALWFDRSEGQFANTKYAQGGVSGNISLETAPNATAIIRGEYNRFARGLYTNAFRAANAVRTAGTGLAAADLNYTINDLSSGKIGVEIAGLSMDGDSSGNIINRSKNFYYDLHADYTTQVKKTQLSVRGRFLRETLESKLDSNSLASSFGLLGAEVLQNISPIMTAAFGADFHYFSQDTLFERSRISPFGRVNFMPGDRFGISLQLSTGLAYETMLQHWENNPYVSHVLPLRPSEQRLGLALKTDIRLSDKIKFQGSYARSWMAEMYYWQADTTDGLLARQAIKDVDLAEIQIGVLAKLSEKTHLQVVYIDYSDKIPSTDGELLSNFNRLPYRADFRMPIRASLQLLPKLNLMVTADIVGERKKNINSNATLGAYALLHADLTAKVDRNFSALLSVKNLLNAKHTIWEGYPEMGIIVSAGLRARF